jgi:hypothetical protein
MRKLFKILAVLLAIALVPAIWLIWTGFSTLWAKIPNTQTTTCEQMDAMNKLEMTYLMAALITHYESKGGDLSTDAKNEAFVQVIIDKCDGAPNLQLRAIVDEMPANLASQAP